MIHYEHVGVGPTHDAALQPPLVLTSSPSLSKAPHTLGVAAELFKLSGAIHEHSVSRPEWSTGVATRQGFGFFPGCPRAHQHVENLHQWDSRHESHRQLGQQNDSTLGIIEPVAEPALLGWSIAPTDDVEGASRTVPSEVLRTQEAW